jgi:cellulose synthase/poly-beta-1,6-N-acetylglucosamine synthase-like glycosyltransferase
MFAFAMKTIVFDLVLALYFVPSLILMIYGLNCYVLLALFLRRRREAEAARRNAQRLVGDPVRRDDLPVVTTQVAIYNEINVAERVIRAVCAMDYPAARHEIQLLDDSTDETRNVVDRVSDEMRRNGHDVRVIRRAKRVGFKGGALAEAVAVARGELVAVFDADFIPPRDFLLSMVPFFLADAKLGFAQARWGHLNRDVSLLTRAQSIGIDGHFVVEQVARGWNRLFMNFNGTAGMWRREAIQSSGGWQWDTLTEDLDLSYRVQFTGWHALYLPDLVVPAELPETVTAFRNQQFRWAKGSFQTLLKLLPLLREARAPFFKKYQAILHIAGYAVHPMMLTLSLLALPVLFITARMSPPSWVYSILALPLVLAIVGPTAMYVVSQAAINKRGLPANLLLMPFMVVVGVGLALSNTRAIAEAIAGHESEFVRTPKRGDREVKRYHARIPWLAIVEFVLGIYCVVTVICYLRAGSLFGVPFLAIYALGYFYVSAHSLADAVAPKRTDPAPST